MRLVFILSLFWMSCVLLANWPGNISLDGLSYLNRFLIRQDPFWKFGGIESFLYGLIVFVSAKLSSILLPLTIFTIVLSSLVIARLHFVVSKKMHMPRLAWGLSLFILFAPGSVQVILLWERDILFGWFIAALLLQMVELSLVEDKPPAWRYVLMIFTLGFVLGLKKEGVVYLLLPIQLVLLKKLQGKGIIQFSALVAVVFGLVSVGPQLFGNRNIAYQASDPGNLSFFLFSLPYMAGHKSDPISEQDLYYSTLGVRLQNSGKKLSRSDLGREPKEYIFQLTDIANLNAEERLAYFRYGLGEIFRRPDLYLRFCFIKLKDFLSNTMFFTEDRFGVFQGLITRHPEILPAPKWPWLKGVLDSAHEAMQLNAILEYLTPGPRLGVVVLGLSALMLPFGGGVGKISLAPLAHFFFVILFSPYGAPKYLYFCYPAAFVFLAALIYELRRLVRGPASPAADT